MINIPSIPKDTLKNIVVLLRNQTGHNFTCYKSDVMIRQVSYRMMVNRIAHISDYLCYLQCHASEQITLSQELLIGVTRFFRDKEAFESLEHHVVTHLFEHHQSYQPVRIWVPGCSTGEEACSIAILVREYLESIHSDHKVQIFATDVDRNGLERAFLGWYPERIAADISPERLQRFFVHEQHGYRIHQDIRNMIVFSLQDVTHDPPFLHVDFLSCRNLLIYLDSQWQEYVLSRFYSALNPGGFLFIGASESPGDVAHLFTPMDKKWQIFQKRVHLHVLTDCA